MARLATITNSFNAGEWSPVMIGRNDLAKYDSATRTMLNALPMKQGGFRRRSGTQFINEVFDSTQFTRLIPFTFNTFQTYVLEFGSGYIRFYKDRGLLEEAPGLPTEIPTSITEEQVEELTFTQSGDTLFICHPVREPLELTRVGDDDTLQASWSLTQLNPKDGPWQLVNNTDTTLSFTAPAGGTSTVTASADVFVSTDPDTQRPVRIYADDGTNSEWFVGKIITFNSPTSVVVDWDTNRGPLDASVDPTDIWRLGAWSRSTGFPRAVTFHQERLWFGGTDANPNYVWGSQTNDFDRYSPDSPEDGVWGGFVDDDDAVMYEIVANEVDIIRHLVSSPKGLAIMTAGGEYLLAARDPFEPITPTNFGATRQATYGSKEVAAPLQVGTAVLFVQQAGRKLRELVFQFERDQYVAPDLTILSEHITESEVKYLAYQQEPDSVVWCVREDGVLLSLTYEREEDVVGWSRHVIGGTDVVVESIAVIRGVKWDEVWVSVRRTINGATKRYVEIINDVFEVIDAKEDGRFADSGLPGAGGPTLAGLDHLEGETVTILADGAVLPDQQVVGGEIVLDGTYAKIWVGLAYETDVQSLPQVVPAQFVMSTRRQKGWRLTVRYVHSLGGLFGFGEGEETAFTRAGGDPMDASPPLRTGVFSTAVESSWERDVEYRLRQLQPLPLMITQVVSDIDLGGP